MIKITKNVAKNYITYCLDIIKKWLYLLLFLFFGFIIYSFFFMSMCACGDDPVTQARTRDAKRIFNLKKIQQWLNSYISVEKSAPTFEMFTWTDALEQYLVPNFLEELWNAPKWNEKYYYKSVGNAWFILLSEMEASYSSCNLVASTIGEVNQKLAGKSIEDIQSLLNKYDKTNKEKCFLVLTNSAH